MVTAKPGHHASSDAGFSRSIFPHFSDGHVPTALPPLQPVSTSVAESASKVTLPPLSAAIQDTSADSRLYSSHPSSTSVSAPTASFCHSASSIMDVDSNGIVDERSRRAASVLSMDDLEAAQALEGLRSDYGSSPRASYQQTSTVSSSSPTSRESNRPEPLLSLLTSTHPLISSAIHSSMSAYTSSKSYSPRFKYGAEFIERNIGSPVANTVGTVGRKTGVESGLRWALQRRESASAENSRSKRRKMDEKTSSRDVDVERGLQNPVSSYRIRSSSSASATESLPPYDDQSSPKYEEVNQQSITPSCNQRQIPPTWQSRLMISTSGLGVAMSEESLRSLQYCLTWLRWANGRLGNAIVALQSTLKEWEEYKQQNPNDFGATASTGTDGSSKILLSQRIQAVREDVLATLKRVVDVVSKYAGGALPENARNLVRRHLTSLPQRFQIASTSNPPPYSAALESDATVGAHRILVLAQEGLDMMAQVSVVVNDTLVSAEQWCERLGKRRPNEKDASETHGLSPVNESFPVDIEKPIVTESYLSDTPMGGMKGKV